MSVGFEYASVDRVRHMLARKGAKYSFCNREKVEHKGKGAKNEGEKLFGKQRRRRETTKMRTGPDAGRDKLTQARRPRRRRGGRLQRGGLVVERPRLGQCVHGGSDLAFRHMLISPGSRRTGGSWSHWRQVEGHDRREWGRGWPVMTSQLQVGWWF